MLPINSSTNNRKPLLDKRRSILISILILIIIGAFLRAYGLNKVYTEYDDIGVVSANKSFVGTAVINPFAGLIDYPMKIDSASVRSIENSMLYPFYISYIWTYAPGQYIFLPLLLNEDDEFDVVVYKGRIISVIFSVMGLFLLAYLMYLVNGKLLTWVIPVVLTIPIFSANSILYAHHMSPYSAYFFSTSLGLVLLYQYFISRITFRQIIVLLGLLLYLSWFIVLFALPVFLIYIVKLRDEHGTRSLKKYIKDLASVLIGLVITLPGLLILQSKEISRGIMPPDFTGLSSLIDIAYHLVKQFYVSMKSILYGVVRYEYLFIILCIVIGFLLIKKLVIDYKKSRESRIYIVSILFFLIQWIFLHLYGTLRLDESRHMLAILPLITIVIFYALKDINIRGWRHSILTIIIISIASFSSTIYSIDLLESKYTNFNYNFLNSRDEEVILLYHGTLGPLKYYDKTEKLVYFIEVNSFQNNYLEMDFPEEILLVGQAHPIMNKGLYDKYKKNLPGLFCNYSIQTLYEKESDIFFTYNNYPSGSNSNGMFVYQMRKTKVNQC